MSIARGSGWGIRPQLERAGQTLLAKKQPDRTRSARLAALQAFADDVYRRGRNADYRFASGLQRRPFPVTKKDFIDVFIQQYPEFGGSALATLKDDLVVAKIRFAFGQKDNPNNVVVKLFEKK